MVRLEPVNAYTLGSGPVGRVSLDFPLRYSRTTNSNFDLRTIGHVKRNTSQVLDGWSEVAELCVLDRGDVYNCCAVTLSFGKSQTIQREVVA